MNGNCFYLILLFITVKLYIISTLVLIVLIEFNVHYIDSFIIMSVIIFVLFSNYIRVISDESSAVFNLDVIKKLTFFWLLFKKEKQQ